MDENEQVEAWLAAEELSASIPTSPQRTIGPDRVSRKTCDQCRRRKVRCNGESPCPRCVQSQLQCRRDDPTRRRGPRAGRGSMITRLRNAHFPSDDGTLPFAPTSDPFFSISGRHGQAAIQALHSREEHDPTPAGAVASESDHETDPASETTLGEVLVVEDGVERHPKRDEMVGTPLWGDGHVSGALCAVDDDGVSSDPPSDSPHHFVAHLCNNSTLLSDAPLSGYTSSWTSSTSLEELRLREPPRLRSCPLGVEAIAKSLDVSPFLILECVHKFFGDLYPIMPVLDEARIRTILSQSLEPGDYCVVVAQCAITLLRTPTVFDLDVETRRGMVQLMVRHCQRLKLTSDFTSQIDSEAVVLSYLISLICFDLQQSRAHQHHLGKALQLGGQKITSGSDPGMYVAEDLPIRQKAGCLSTLLYITEVSSAILRGHRRRVRRLENLTTDVWQPIDGHIVMGLRNLYTLFYTLDSLVFLPSGEAVEGPAEGDLRTRIAQVQAMLAESNDTTFRASTQSQVPDLLITRQWSRLVLWHFSLKLGMVTNAGVGPNSAFNYCFPLAIGESLCSTLKTLSMESMQLHGHEKIFEIANAVLDLILVQHTSPRAEEDFAYMYELLAASPLSRKMYASILETKFTNVATT